MRRIRSSIDRSLYHSKWQGNPIDGNATEVYYDLNSDGGIEQHEINHIVLPDCNHRANPAGSCSVCSREYCAECLMRCRSCWKPICGFHSIEGKNEERYCTECFSAQKRAATTKTLLKLLASPLIRFKSEDQQ